MAGLASINIKFVADLKQFSTNMQNASRSMQKMGQDLTKMGTNLSVGLTAPLVAFGAVALANFDKQAKAIAQIDAGIKSTGGAAGFTSQELQKMASDLQNISLFGDEEILQSSTAQLLTFTNIAGEQFARTQKAALDLATRLGGDLQSATIQLGKALNDPVANLSALSRSGIQFSEDQKKMINSLVQTNKLSEAQTLILDELNKQYGGAAEAAAKAGLGGMKQLANSIGDLTEDFGKIISEAIAPFIVRVKEMVAGFQRLSPETKKTIVIFGSLAAAIGPVLVVLGLMMTSVIPGLITAFGYLRAGLVLLQANFVKLTAVIAANPFGALAVALAAVASYFIFFNKTTDETVKKQTLLAQVNNEAAKSIANEKAKLEELLFIARNENIAKSARLKAIQEINKISPEFLGNLTLETINTDAARIAVEKYNAELLKTAKVKAAQNKLVDIQSKIIDAELAAEKDSIENAKRYLKLKDEAVSKEDLLKVRVMERAMAEGNVKGLYDFRAEALKKEADQLLKIIAANQTINKVISEGTGSGNKTATVLDGPKMVGIQDLTMSNGLAVEGEKINTFLTRMTEKLTAFQAFSGELANAVGASFGAMGNQIASVFETGNTILDAFIGSIINSLSQMASAFVNQLLIEKIFATGKKAVDFGKASSNAIVAATSLSAAMGPAGFFALPGLIASSVATVGTAFAGIQAFANGGIVGGSSMTGDKLFARVNSGEMILNRNQQGNLAGMLSAGNNVNIQLSPGIRMQGRELVVFLEEEGKKLNRTR